jgi:hypothetical protein
VEEVVVVVVALLSVRLEARHLQEELMEDRDREAVTRLGTGIPFNMAKCSPGIQILWELANKEYEK